MAIRTFDEIVVDLITNILRANEKIDVSPGQVVRDIMINPPSLEFEKLYAEIDQVRTSQTLANANVMSLESLDNLASNYGVKRNPPNKATGKVVFYSAVQPTSDVEIPAGTRIATSSQNNSDQTVFVTQNNVTFIAAIESTFYNPDTGYWEVSSDVESEQAGSNGNIGPFSIISILNFNSPFRVVNRIPMTGGSDQESNNDLAFRTLNAFLGNNKGTKNGYLGTILSQPDVTDALVVGPGEELMDRDGGQGGKVDIWVLTPSISSTQLSPTTTPSLSINWNDQQQSLVGYKFTFPNLPLDVNSTTNLLGTTSPVNPLINVQLFESRNPAPSGLGYINPGEFHYTIFKSDDLDKANSFEANDFIIWNPNTLNKLQTYPSGLNVSNTLQIDVTYSYNKTINDLQAVIDSDSNKIITADVLVKDSKKITLDITMNVVLLPDFKATSNTEQQTINSVITAITNSINSSKLGTKVEKSTLVQLAKEVNGVDDVIIPSIIITRNENPIYGIQPLQVEDTQAFSNEYFESGNVNIFSVSV